MDSISQEPGRRHSVKWHDAHFVLLTFGLCDRICMASRGKTLPVRLNKADLGDASRNDVPSTRMTRVGGHIQFATFVSGARRVPSIQDGMHFRMYGVGELDYG